MPSEKSDLCRESDCVFELLLLSLAVRGQRVTEQTGGEGAARGGGGEGRGGEARRGEARGGEVRADWWRAQVLVTEEELHKARRSASNCKGNKVNREFVF